MSDLLKIKITLADRIYPLTIKRSEEENLRKAARSIAAILKKYEEGYAVRDKQDLLAMCALQLAARLEKSQDEDLVDGSKVSEQLRNFEDKIQQVLD